jgi:hypothetical protein
MSNTPLDLTLGEIVAYLRGAGWKVSSPIEGVYIDNTVRVLVDHLLVESVELSRVDHQTFKIVPLRRNR